MWADSALLVKLRYILYCSLLRWRPSLTMFRCRPVRCPVQMHMLRLLISCSDEYWFLLCSWAEVFLSYSDADLVFLVIFCSDAHRFLSKSDANHSFLLTSNLDLFVPSWGVHRYSCPIQMRIYSCIVQMQSRPIVLFRCGAILLLMHTYLYPVYVQRHSCPVQMQSPVHIQRYSCPVQMQTLF